jgi:hypothetical protein
MEALSVVPVRPSQGRALQLHESRQRGGNTHWASHWDAHLTEKDISRFPGARHRLLEQWRPFFDKPGAPILVEKSPRIS